MTEIIKACSLVLSYSHGFITVIATAEQSSSNIFAIFRSKMLLQFQLIGDTLPETDPDYNILWEFIDLLYTLLEPSYDGPLRAFPLLRFLPGKWGRVFRATIKARDRVAKRYFDSQKVGSSSVKLFNCD